MSRNFRFLSLIPVLALALPACGDDGSGTSSASMGTTSDTDPTGTESQSTSTTMDPTSESSTGPVEPQPNGGPCMVDTDCESEKCFIIPVLGGVCGECLGDADCDNGCSIPNPLGDPPTGAMCNDGMLGEGCETDEACNEGKCVTVLEIPSVIIIRTCSSCDPELMECADPQLCQPTLQLEEVKGEWSCVDPMSIPNDQACDDMYGGDMACESGFCTNADVMGFVQVGLCGECDPDNGDADCMMGQTCMAAEIDIMGTVVGSKCV